MESEAAGSTRDPDVGGPAKVAGVGRAVKSWLLLLLLLELRAKLYTASGTELWRMIVIRVFKPAVRSEALAEADPQKRTRTDGVVASWQGTKVSKECLRQSVITT